MKNQIGLLIENDFATHFQDETYERCIEIFSKVPSHGRAFLVLKRVMDILFSFVVIVILSIPMCIIGLIIRLDSHGPAIFSSERIGRGMRIFKCFKFRTMRCDAPSNVPSSLELMHPYITRVGHFLRKTSIDEIPQFINILLGDMSIIGYRPLVPSETECNELRNRMHVFTMKPGISGLAQVNGRDDVYYKNKAVMDAYYVAHASCLTDLGLMIRTALVVLRMSGNEDAKSRKL